MWLKIKPNYNKINKLSKEFFTKTEDIFFNIN